MFIYNFYWLVSHLLLNSRFKTTLEIRRKAVHSKILKYFSSKSMNVLSVQKITISDKQLIKKYFRKKIPFVIKNGCDEELLKKWSFEFLSEEYGEAEQPTFKNTNSQTAVSFEKVKKIISEINNGSLDYNLLFGNLIHTNAKLGEDLKNLFHKNLMQYKMGILKVDHLFLSSKGTSTHPHTEFGENIFLQVKGSKKWYIYFPNFAPAFLPMIQRKFFLQSVPELSNLSKSPELLSIPHYEIVLNKGDILYNPCLHWHFVETLENSICVSSRWTNLTNVFRYPFISFILGTATNPTVWHQMTNSKETYPSELH